MSMNLEMNSLGYRKAVFIVLVICHVTKFVAPTTSNGNSLLISTASDADDEPKQTGFNAGSQRFDPLKALDHIAGNQHLRKKQGDESNAANINNNEQEEDTQQFISSKNIEWKIASAIQKETPNVQLGIRGTRTKRDAQGDRDKRLNYDRMGKRNLGEAKRFTDAMRLGKRGENPGGSSSFVDAMRLGKRYSDAMRLGKRSAMDTMRLGKRMDAMRLGKRSAMDSMRLGKRMHEMRFGKRMDQMRLGKRNYNGFQYMDTNRLQSLANGKRMSDVMRLGKRNDKTDAGVEHARPDMLLQKPESPTAGKRMTDLMRLGKRGLNSWMEFFNEFGNNADGEPKGVEKRMSDLMRLGKRMDIVPLEPEKRMGDLMRLGKRFGYDDRYGKRAFEDRYGKRAFMDEMRMGKRAFMDDMRMGKRMGDVMRLGKRMPDAMRLGKRNILNSEEYPVEYDPTALTNHFVYVNDDYDEDVDGHNEV